MIVEHPLWWTLSWACVGWYAAVTVYVAVKGAAEVAQMLRRLGKRREGPFPRE